MGDISHSLSYLMQYAFQHLFIEISLKMRQSQQTMSRMRGPGGMGP